MNNLGGLNLSRRGLNRDSRSWRHQRVSLDSRENLDSVKKCVSTVQKSWSRSRLLDFVSTSMSRPKSLDQDWEIHRDLKILACLDSLSWSQLRSAWIFVFSHRDFSIRQDFSSFQTQKALTMSRFLNKSQKSWRVLTNLDNLNESKSRLNNHDFKNHNWGKKSWSRPSRKSWQFKKVSLDTKDALDLNLDWSRLPRPPCLLMNKKLIYFLLFLTFLYWSKTIIFISGQIEPTYYWKKMFRDSNFKVKCYLRTSTSDWTHSSPKLKFEIQISKENTFKELFRTLCFFTLTFYNT